MKGRLGQLAGFGIGGEDDGADVAAEEVILGDTPEALDGGRAEVEVDGGEKGVGEGGGGPLVALAAGQTEIEEVFFRENGCDVLNELGGEGEKSPVAGGM